LPLVIASFFFTTLTTWREGRDIVTSNRARGGVPFDAFVKALGERAFPVVQVPGTAVFLNANPQTTPLAMRANVEHNHVIHETVVIVSIRTERVPHVAASDRLLSDDLGDPHDSITRVTARFGFQDDTDVPATLALADRLGMLENAGNLGEVTYFVSQITIVPSRAPGMAMWRKRLFLHLAHNAANPVLYFGLPDNRTVTMGERIDV
ncbi:MAG: KUP/HAK/KT family potassium transporter, partial [Solirubrobacteraceae bacterium]